VGFYSSVTLNRGRVKESGTAKWEVEIEDVTEEEEE
jgi:hypothetical protein